ncbi:hypothetical protein [Streptomyces sp. UNOC14_S4]|uniref:hypothetical protein n=1 Tax=Streptomyces sp. UNOC14_S4 TaxID=2872340 RepID=UPI001E378E3E|nr:hypothetical protein [Streptomyces sp. UNOC14_S4]MCC3769517.1 hypothetical protein [Streptomyces sp. UNOC14_S4]
MRTPYRAAATAAALALAATGLLTTGSAHAAPHATTPHAAPRLAQSCSQSHLPLPDSSCQPGAYNPDVTQATIGSTICVPGWTKTVRPPASYTNRLKVQQIGEYGYTDTDTADYEEDHLVPLELGGAPKDAKNLWPEPRYGNEQAGDKDHVENRLKTAVCGGEVTLDAARSAIATDWTTALAGLGLE